MVDLVVTELEDHVIEALRREAHRSGRSVEDVARVVIEGYAASVLAQETRREHMLEQLDAMKALREEIRARNGGDLSDSSLLIREDRDR